MDQIVGLIGDILVDWGERMQRYAARKLAKACGIEPGDDGPERLRKLVQYMDGGA